MHDTYIVLVLITTAQHFITWRMIFVIISSYSWLVYDVGRGTTPFKIGWICNERIASLVICHGFGNSFWY